MKKSLFVILFLSITQVCNGQNTPEDTAIRMLRGFYTNYMTLIASATPANSSANDKKCVLLKKEYCTKKLLSSLPKLAEQCDCDPIIYAQDSRTDCVRNLTFKRNDNKPNLYAVSYFYIDGYSKKRENFVINLTLVNHDGKYQIDSILQSRLY